MNGEVSDYTALQWLALFETAYMSLHSADPIRSGVNSEVQGGSYKRLLIPWAHETRTLWLGQKLRWTGLPMVTISHIGVWDLAHNGNLLAAAILPAPFPHVGQGGAFELDSHTMGITIGLPGG